MSRSIGFHFYSVRIWQKHTREREVLSALRGHQDALFLLLKDFRSIVGKKEDDEAAHRLARIQNIQNDGRHITGLIESGSYGETADIVNHLTGDRSHHQALEEAVLMPCFFRLILPLGENSGLLILQHDTRVAAKAALSRLINQALHRFDNKLTCGLDPIVNAATFERMIRDGQVQELRFIRTSLPKDMADAYAKGRKETRGTAEVVVRAPRNDFLTIKNLLTGWLNHPETLTHYVIPGLSFEFQTVKAEVKIGQKVQTIDFGRGVTQPIVDVSSKVVFDNRTGHPTYASLQEITSELATDESYTSYGD